MNGRPLPEHWRCEQCGLSFVLDFSPTVMCAAHGESDHCHTGQVILCADGSTQYATASPSCLPYATTEWAE